MQSQLMSSVHLILCNPFTANVKHPMALSLCLFGSCIQLAWLPHCQTPPTLGFGVFKLEDLYLWFLYDI